MPPGLDTPAAPGASPPVPAGAAETAPDDPARPTVPPPGSRTLFTPSFRLLMAVTFLGFGMESIMRAVVPLMVLARGGDAVAVGLVATAYALPALLFRPLVGQLVDGWQHQRLFRGGILASSTMPLLLLVPGVPTLMVVRFLTGTGWAFFAVSNHSMMAKLAPPKRRAEAVAWIITMSALAALFLPSLGVTLYTAIGEAAPVLFGVALGLAATAVTFRIQVPAPAVRPTAAAAGESRRLVDRLIEPSALAPTALLVLSFSAWSLFTVFPQVYVLHLGLPVEVLVVYFAIFGFAQVVSQPFFGRFADVLGRSRSIVIGAGLSLAGLLIAVIPAATVHPMASFTAAASLYALGQALLNPTISALVMERAPRHRLGSAMATYSIAYQFATGTSSILWGAIITASNFSVVFVVAAALQVVTIASTRPLLARGLTSQSPRA